ncbi:MAG: biotin--[acetyl-CoA-carboxylase] ligase [Gemmatimonadota bacterium]|nr:biotin--[acetyl-CoA-carboxylase] ligase [Gemmatimonadota bacterium]
MTRRRVKSWGGVPVAELQDRWGRESVHVYGDIDSTMDAARDLAAAGAPGGAIVMSRGQSAGRGRAEARFHSPRDAGVYLTMIFRPEGDWVRSPVTILAGLGVATELRRAFPDLAPRLKWPNDLIVRDRKLGGILAETMAGDDGADVLLIGVGVNLDTEHLPADLQGRVVGVRELCEAAPVDVADAMIRGLERWLPDPPEALSEEQLDELDRLDWLKNQRIALVGPDHDPVPGRSAGLAPDGALLFRPDRGALRRVNSGSVEVLEETS